MDKPFTIPPLGLVVSVFVFGSELSMLFLMFPISPCPNFPVLPAED